MNKKTVISVILCCLCVLTAGCRSLRDEMKSFPVLSEPVPEELQGTDSMEDIRFEPYSEGVYIPFAIIYGKDIRFFDEEHSPDRNYEYFYDHGLITDALPIRTPGMLNYMLFGNDMEVTEKDFLFLKEEYKKALPLLLADLPSDVVSAEPVFSGEQEAITGFDILLKKAWNTDDARYAELRDQLMLVSEHYNNDFLRAEQTLPLHIICKSTASGETVIEETIPGGTELYIIPYSVFLPEGRDPEKLSAEECREIARTYGLRSFRPRTEALKMFTFKDPFHCLTVQMTPAVRKELLARYRAAVEQDADMCINSSKYPWIRNIETVMDEESKIESLLVKVDADAMLNKKGDPWDRTPLKQLLRDAQNYNGFLNSVLVKNMPGSGAVRSGLTYVNTCFVDAATNQRLPELYPQETVKTEAWETETAPDVDFVN